MEDNDKRYPSDGSKYEGYNAKSSSRPAVAAKKRKKKSSSFGRGVFVTVIIVILFILIILAILAIAGVFDRGDKGPSSAPKSESVSAQTAVGDELKVHFIDVGQADCILIECDEGALMIDAGKNNDSPKIAAYLNELGIKRLDYIIGSHAHADHMGGMDDIIEGYEVDEVILPTKGSEARFYRDVISAAEEKNVKMRTAEKGESMSTAGGKLDVIDDGSDFLDGANNNSYIMKFTYGETVFLFTGDAEEGYEREVLSDGADVDADVLKAGHHGSATSTCDEFLSSVSPDYVVIQVGERNRYGHPSQSVIDKIKATGAEIYRNDEQGDVVVTTDGKNISVATSAAAGR